MQSRARRARRARAGEAARSGAPMGRPSTMASSSTTSTDASTVSTAMYAFLRPCAVQSSSSTCGSSTTDSVVATTDVVTAPGGTPWPLVKRAAACRAAHRGCQHGYMGDTKPGALLWSTV